MDKRYRLRVQAGRYGNWIGNWTREEAEQRFFGPSKTGRHFQRVVILDHEGVVIDTLTNPMPCTSIPCSGEFSLPDPTDDLIQVPIDISR